MSRPQDRAGIPLEHRVPFLEGDVDKLESDVAKFEVLLDQFEHHLADIKREVRADIAATREDVGGKFNKVLLALLGLLLTIIGGIVTGLVLAGVGP